MDKVRKSIIDSDRPLNEKVRLLSLLARDDDFRLAAATEAQASDAKLRRFLDEKLRRVPVAGGGAHEESDDETDLEAVIRAADEYVLKEVERLTDPAALKARADDLVGQAVESYVLAAFGLTASRITRNGETVTEIRTSGKLDETVKNTAVSKVKGISEKTVAAAIDKAIGSFESDARIADAVALAVEAAMNKEIDIAARKIAAERAKTRVERASQKVREGYDKGA